MPSTEIDNLQQAALTWLDEHGDFLYGYALSRLGNQQAVAEDLVQDTLLAGMEGYARFEGGSSVRTWLVGILRNKILAHYRKEFRRNEILDGESFFNQKGHIQNVARWKDCPDEALGTAEFMAMLDACLSKLSPAAAAAFMMSIMDGMSTDEVCQQLEISPKNLSVRLHRARLAMRQCIQTQWLAGEA